LPGAVPLPAGDRVIYRSARGIQAADRRTGEPVWESPSDWGLDRMVRQLRFHPYLTACVSGYAVNNTHLLFANAILGSLSTDGTRVYAVDDLPMPPFPLSTASVGRGRRGALYEPVVGPDLADVAYH